MLIGLCLPRSLYNTRHLFRTVAQHDNSNDSRSTASAALMSNNSPPFFLFASISAMKINMSLIRIYTERSRITVGLAYAAKKYQVPSRRYYTAKFCPQTP